MWDFMLYASTVKSFSQALMGHDLRSQMLTEYSMNKQSTHHQPVRFYVDYVSYVVTSLSWSEYLPNCDL